MSIIDRALQTISNAIDTAELARAVHRLSRQVEALTLQAREQEDRADVTEAAAEEYRALYRANIHGEVIRDLEWKLQGSERLRKEAERELVDLKAERKMAHDVLDEADCSLSRLNAPVPVRIAALVPLGRRAV